MDKKMFVAVLCMLVGVLILVQQYIDYHVWFELGDVHHETFAVGFFSLAVGIIIGKARWR